MSKIKLKVYRAHHTSFDEKGKHKKFEQGDTFMGSERELEAFSDRLERAEGGTRKKQRLKTIDRAPEPAPEATAE